MPSIRGPACLNALTRSYLPFRVLTCPQSRDQSSYLPLRVLICPQSRDQSSYLPFALNYRHTLLLSVSAKHPKYPCRSWTMSEIRLLTDFELIEMNCTSSSSLSLQNADTKAVNEALDELVIGGKFKDRIVDGRVISDEVCL